MPLQLSESKKSLYMTDMTELYVTIKKRVGTK